jgi:hypothetical protein
MAPNIAQKIHELVQANKIMMSVHKINIKLLSQHQIKKVIYFIKISSLVAKKNSAF